MEKGGILNKGEARMRLTIIILSGALLRILFSLYGGNLYFGQEEFKIQGDTYGWIDSILNLIRSGEYTSDPTEPNAHFFRPPGYAFIIGFFYLLSGENLDYALNILSWTQVVLDSIGIWLIYRIGQNIQLNQKASEISAVLYAIYPFTIVWTPVLYAESTSVFFVLSSLFFLTSKNEGKKLAWSGIFLGLSVLTRLQCFFILPATLLYLAKRTKQFNRLKSLIIFLSAFLVVYGSWPLRNILLHGKPVFSQDLNVGKHWSPDYMAFMDFIFAVKTDHQPQYKQIIENQPVEWPESVRLGHEDSTLMNETIRLCRTCGTGFSYFKYHAGLIDQPVPKASNCDSLIENNFAKLKSIQIRKNPLNHYLYTPLSNLKKALFKLNLYGDKGFLIKLAASSLFIGRTILIFSGLLAIWINRKKKWFESDFSNLVAVYFASWYLFLCFLYRNIEIRYLLHCDILLLIPSAFLFSAIFQKARRTTFKS